MTAAPILSDDDDALAGEYALGVLDQADHEACTARVMTDPAFAAAVVAWETRLGPLLSQVSAVAPTRDLWPQIAAVLPPAAGAARPGTVVTQIRTRSTLWDRVGFWRPMALGASALAAACLAGLVFVGTARPPSPLGATLAADSGAPAFVAMLDVGARQISLMPVAMPSADGRAMELWMIAGASAPVSLGIIPAAAARIPMPSGLGQAGTQPVVLAISLEPAGGSPTGQPTGPVVAKGALTRL